jgi:hypothetical protein
MELTPKFIHEQLRHERVLTRDVGYICDPVEVWWANHRPNLSNHALKLQLISLLSDTLREDDKLYFDSVGKNGISAVCLTGVFRTDNYCLAFIVHEALCELFHLRDIKYPYENHKAIFLKTNAERYRNWGNGYGEITPHSDDLYEVESTDLLALTVCRDKTCTPTQYFLAKNIIDGLSDTELRQLAQMSARFRSGKNVEISKSHERKLIQYDPTYGIQICLDFRVDTDIGARMVPTNPVDRPLIRRIRQQIPSWTPTCSAATTGTFLILANHKVLHARPVLNLDIHTATTHARRTKLSETPRLLFRSKGPRHHLSLAPGYDAYL